MPQRPRGRSRACCNLSSGFDSRRTQQRAHLSPGSRGRIKTRCKCKACSTRVHANTVLFRAFCPKPPSTESLPRHITAMSLRWSMRTPPSNDRGAGSTPLNAKMMDIVVHHCSASQAFGSDRSISRTTRHLSCHGDVAQMVERLLSMQEVPGSIPGISTTLLAA